MTWTKGQSGNPNGGPRDKAFADAIRMVINEDDPVRGKRKLRCLAERLYEDAMNGEGWAMCQIADRLDGKPLVSAEVKSDSTVTFVARIPDKAQTASEWQKQHSPETTDKTLQ